MQRFWIFVFVLSFYILTTLTQHQETNQRSIQSETRIKLPSDIAFTHESNSDIEGETCYNLLRRVNGICTLPNQCPEAIKDFKKGIQPQICNYNQHVPIICCPRPSAVVTSNVNTVSEYSTAPSITTRSTQQYITDSSTETSYYSRPRISKQKCKQYMKLSIEENIVTTLSLNPENRPVQKSKCRKASSEGFIVGGTKTEPGEFAHMATIGWQQEVGGPIEWNCGGSLISYRYVLSAAHCASWRSIKPKFIRLGDQNLKRTDDGAQIQEFSIAQVIRHPNYKPPSKYNDIALFKLDRDVIISDFVHPACLWQTFNVNYTTAIATGWGLTKDRGQQSDDLLKVSLYFTSNERCNTFYERFQAIKNGVIDSQICAGDDNEVKDTCNGDSGGPIQIATPNSACSYHLIGITSFGKGCGSGYGVYTRVSQFLDWIESIVWIDSN